jgi:hypothetical protein
MTAIASPPIPARPYPARRAPKGSVLRNLVTTTDHKTLGLMYLVTSFAFFLSDSTKVVAKHQNLSATDSTCAAQ